VVQAVAGSSPVAHPPQAFAMACISGCLDARA
jgi:hypothetical protein